MGVHKPGDKSSILWFVPIIKASTKTKNSDDRKKDRCNIVFRM